MHAPVATLPERLRASAAFAFALMPDGRPFVTEVAEPYRQFWLDERDRQLLAACSSRRGSRPGDALACVGGSGATPTLQRQLQRRLHTLWRAGVLEDPGRGASRYAGAVVKAYLRHRPFPAAVCADVVRRTRLQDSHRVLDLAGGPGDLALQLARRSSHVSLMDWSGPFLAAARQRARAARLPLHTLHESANRLMLDDSVYDVITVCQALHWLDDLSVCRGVVQALREGGHFVVVHSQFDVPPAHPLAHVLGQDSVLGPRVPTPFADEVQALHHRTDLLLRAVQAPGTDRVAAERRRAAPERALGPAGLRLWRQQRPMGLGFVQALLSEQHIRDAGFEPGAFMADVRRRCAAATPRQLTGTQNWALLHYASGGQATLDAHRAPVGRLPAPSAN